MVPDIRTIIGPDSPDILWEFAETLTERLQARVRYVHNRTEAVIEEIFSEHVKYLVEQGDSGSQAVLRVNASLASWHQEIVQGRDGVIEQEEEWFRERMQRVQSRPCALMPGFSAFLASSCQGSCPASRS